MKDVPEQTFRATVLAPIHLKPLLEIYCSPASANCPHLMTLRSTEVLKELRDMGLIKQPECAIQDGYHGLEVTDRGRVYIDALLRLPLPVQVWAVPINDRPLR